MDWNRAVIGIEFGSTRIKAVLMDENHLPVASGSYDWENQFVDGIWTYSMDEIHKGMHECYADLARDVKEQFGTDLTKVGALGISGMMHGYLPFDAEGNLLVPFRTWRNTITGEAAEKLTELFGFNIPQRWSIAHLYQAILNKEPHVDKIAYITTLAGYIHWKLTGQKVMGIGEASGMFPIDSDALDFNQTMVEKFDEISGMPWKFRDIFPKVLVAGDDAGKLTSEGVEFLDPSGLLEAGIPVAPPEGDAGTGMAATNSVRVRTGNVSAGTSDFAMLVTEKNPGVHREIDMVTTPSGMPVAMVHCNNCTSDLNAWGNLLKEFAGLLGVELNLGQVLTMIFQRSLEADEDCGGLLSYNYFSGEGVTDIDEGRPVFLRKPDANLSFANFGRAHVMSALATLKVGLDILINEEKVTVDKLYGHGGFFKTPVAGQKMLSAACGVPVSVMKTAGEGGPYGMALLSAYMINREDGETLEDYLDNKVFAEAESSTVMAEPELVKSFDAYLDAYVKAFPVERAAVHLF
ncbi:MAG: ATPase [Oscillospiraceae bacterium]|nr:ATPase [Oscillospiraceae bacterium]